MRVRVLHAKLYAYALPGSTARQLFISSTLLNSSTARQLPDRPRQTSTELTRRPGAWSQARQARQELDSISTGSTGKASTAPRQYLDSASTESLDTSSTARQPGLNRRPGPRGSTPGAGPPLAFRSSGPPRGPPRPPLRPRPAPPPRSSVEIFIFEGPHVGTRTVGTRTSLEGFRAWPPE